MKVRISICLLVSVSLWFSACGSGGSGTEGGICSGAGGTNPTGSRVYVTNTTGEMGLAISPNGSFLYTSNPNTRLITSFSITSTGTLASLATTLAPNSAPVFLTFDAVGNFLFAINTAGGLAGNGSVSEFTVS